MASRLDLVHALQRMAGLVRVSRGWVLLCALCVGVTACGGSVATSGSAANAGASASAGAFSSSAGAFSDGGSAPDAGAPSGGSGGAPIQGPPADAFADAVAKLVCDALEPCCGTMMLRFDRTACQALNAQYWQRVVERATGPVSFDRFAAQRCLDGYRARIQNCTAAVDLPADCDRLLVGALPPGASCTDPAQCSGALEGAETCGSWGGSNGICEPPVPIRHGAMGATCFGTCGLNGSCNFANAQSAVVACFIDDGVYCSETSLLCTALGAVGAHCLSSSECSAGNYCAPNNDAVGAGSCTPLKVDGAVCESSDSCAAGGCYGSPSICGKVPLESANACLGIDDGLK